MPPFDEFYPAVYREIYASAKKRCLNKVGMETRAVKNCDLFRFYAAFKQFFDFRRNKFPFILSRKKTLYARPLTHSFDVGNERFFVGNVKIPDYLVRVGKKRPFGAVVPEKLDQTGILPLLRKAENVLEICSSESVNALRIVADDHDVAAFRGDKIGNFTLKNVGILILVDHNVLVAVLYPFKGFRQLFEKLQELFKKIVIVEHVALRLVFFILSGNLTDHI